MPNPNVKNCTYYGFGEAHYVMHHAANAIFYVQDATRGGDDTNDGLTPYTPVLTIGRALVLAAAEPAAVLRQIYIFVARTTLGSESFPITISLAYLHLIGTPDQASPTPAIRGDAGHHGLELAAGGIEVAGFLFSGLAGENDACIYSAAGQQWMNHIHHNYFAWDSVAYDCIRLENQQQQISIHHNYFGAHGFTNYAILATGGGGAGRTLIEDNVILVKGREEDGAGGIRMSPLAGASVIRNNDFTVPDNAVGEAIDLVLGQDVLVTRNYAMEGNDAVVTNVPFRDTGSSHWGMNYANDTLQLPS